MKTVQLNTEERELINALRNLDEEQTKRFLQLLVLIFTRRSEADELFNSIRWDWESKLTDLQCAAIDKYLKAHPVNVSEWTNAAEAELLAQKGL